ncbi:Type I secretion system membrane fusion protein PrsE [compost metagenome]
MQIIPTNGDLEIEVNADTRSVDEITLDRQAIVRFPAFHERTTPEIFGRVIQISPSSVVEERTGAAFYRVRIQVPTSERAKLGNRRLIPGMPVEAVMATADRTVLNYLLKPLADQIEHAMREQ